MLGRGQEAIQPRAYTSGSEVRLSALNVSSTPSTALGKLVDLSNTQLRGLHQGQQTFSIEGQGVTSTGFGGSVCTATQLCCCSTKVALDDSYTNRHSGAPIKLFTEAGGRTDGACRATVLNPLSIK